jgi:hypothetical protein
VQTRAAELLGISRRILKYKMDKLGISESPPQVLPAPIAAEESLDAAVDSIEELPLEPANDAIK